MAVITVKKAYRNGLKLPYMKCSACCETKWLYLSNAHSTNVVLGFIDAHGGCEKEEGK